MFDIPGFKSFLDLPVKSINQFALINILTKKKFEKSPAGLLPQFMFLYSNMLSLFRLSSSIKHQHVLSHCSNSYCAVNPGKTRAKNKTS